MAFPLRSSLFAPIAIATLVAGCMGRADLSEGDPGGGGSSSGTSSSGGNGSSSGTSSSSGSGGSSGGISSSSSGSSSGSPTSSSSSSGGISDPDCSQLAVPDIARTCPDGTSVGGQYVLSNHQCVLEFPCPTTTGCNQGASCSPGTGCASVAPGPGPNCSTECQCDSSLLFQCSTVCSSPPPPTGGCYQGAACSPGSGCGTGDGTCTTSCMCTQSGYFDCGTSCEDAGPPPITNPCPNTPVPDICEVCSNGVTECAHAILVMGVCQIEICPAI